MIPCDYCLAPAIAAKLRLLEAHYHEDMMEVFDRLTNLETARPFSEAGALPESAISRHRQAAELPCNTCKMFKTTADGWRCDLNQPEFPYLCDHYTP